MKPKNKRSAWALEILRCPIDDKYTSVGVGVGVSIGVFISIGREDHAAYLNKIIPPDANKYLLLSMLVVKVHFFS